MKLHLAHMLVLQLLQQHDLPQDLEDHHLTLGRYSFLNVRQDQNLSLTLLLSLQHQVLGRFSTQEHSLLLVLSHLVSLRYLL